MWWSQLLYLISWNNRPKRLQITSREHELIKIHMIKLDPPSESGLASWITPFVSSNQLISWRIPSIARRHLSYQFPVACVPDFWWFSFESYMDWSNEFGWTRHSSTTIAFHTNVDWIAIFDIPYSLKGFTSWINYNFSIDIVSRAILRFFLTINCGPWTGTSSIK